MKNPAVFTDITTGARYAGRQDPETGEVHAIDGDAVMALYNALDEALAGGGHPEECGYWSKNLIEDGPAETEAACDCWLSIGRAAMAKARGEAVPA